MSQTPKTKQRTTVPEILPQSWRGIFSPFVFISKLKVDPFGDSITNFVSVCIELVNYSSLNSKKKIPKT